MSCNRSSDEKRLEKQLAEKNDELIKAQDELARAKQTQSPANTISVAKLNQPIVATDRFSTIQVTILSVLGQDEAVSAGRLYGSSVESFAKQGKHLVYYEVIVKNIKLAGEFNVDHDDFKLEDDKGNTYSCEQTADYINGKIHPERTTRGGISFALYSDVKPKRLIYNSGLEADGVPQEIVLTLPAN